MTSNTVPGLQRTLAIGSALSAALLLAACASTPVPKEEMALAKSAVERVGASPRVTSAAPVEIQSARDKLQRANRALEQGNNTEARRLAEQARADARLAEARTSEARSNESLKEVQQGIDALESELGRRSQ